MASTLLTVPVHEIVRHAFPRPPPSDADTVAMATGKAIDSTLSEFGHQVRLGRKPSATSLRTAAAQTFDEAIEEAAVEISAPDRERSLAQVDGVVQAYRTSEIYGLSRPKTRVIVIDGEVGVYAQPDYWDGKNRIFEMKSYLALPPPPDVDLQLRLFQLAFPGFEARLVCFNRHARPVEVAGATVGPPTPDETVRVLRLARTVGRESGEKKVLAYMEGPFAHYFLPKDAP